jgi:hypothetical protein
MPKIELSHKELEFILAFFPVANPMNAFGIKLKKKLLRGMKPISIASRKQKGRELQKWVCAQIAKITGIPYDQADDSCLIHSREMGQAGSDIVLRGVAKERFPFSIECKNTEQISLPSAIEQAKSNIKGYDYWMVVLKSKSIKDTVVVLPWGTFEDIYTEYKEVHF